ncbi:hypothetical protein ACFQY3_22240 [Paenibacillus farraposensis]|uniref:hypothetical protein n=1 Tax=Paenibacillus farraposensis TaxID=2807095 RepID=UPI00361E4727
MNCAQYFFNNDKMVLLVKRQKVYECLLQNSYARRKNLHKKWMPFPYNVNVTIMIGAGIHRLVKNEVGMNFLNLLKKNDCFLSSLWYDMNSWRNEDADGRKIQVNNTALTRTWCCKIAGIS